MSPPGALQSGTDGTFVNYLVDDGSWIGTSIRIDVHCRICANCGYIALFANPRDMPALHQRWQQLKPRQ